MLEQQRTDKRVALVQCPGYGAEQVERAVRQTVDLLGGMARFVSPGQRVLVKPNLLQASDPEKAIVTHPAVVRAVVLLVQAAGGQAVIADNPFVLPLSAVWAVGCASRIAPCKPLRCCRTKRGSIWGIASAATAATRSALNRPSTCDSPGCGAC